MKSNEQKKILEKTKKLKTLNALLLKKLTSKFLSGRSI